ncbi:hypothetical protein [Alteriqipengyuania sp. 357]
MGRETGWAMPMGLLVALGLSACGDGSAEKSAEQERADAEAISQVIAQQTPPPIPLRLQPIGADDIAHNPALGEGAGCSFYAGRGEEPAFIMGGKGGFLKFEGSVHRLAPDAGSAAGPLGTNVKYDGREYSLRIDIDDGAREDGEGEGFWTAPAKIAVVDGYDRPVAGGEGRVSCGG